MIGTILSWLTSGGATAVGKLLNEAYKTKLDAKTEEQKLEADTLIKQLEARQAVLLAEQKHWTTRWIRPAFALPFVIYNAKVLVWDKVFGLGTTDPIAPEFWQLQMIVFGAYFVTRAAEKIFYK